MDAILVSDDFREAYNLLAIISSNPTKPSSIHYIIGKEGEWQLDIICGVHYETHF
jgi:hypothetical protein